MTPQQHAIIIECDEETRVTFEQFPRMEVAAFAQRDAGAAPVALVAPKEMSPDDIMEVGYELVVGLYGQRENNVAHNVVSADTVDTAVFALARCLCVESWPCPECLKVAARHTLPLVREFGMIQRSVPPEIRMVMAKVLEDAERGVLPTDIMRPSDN